MEHVCGTHTWTAVEVERVGLLGDSSPFFRIDFVRSFLLPVFDEVLDEEFDRERSPVGRLGLFEGRVVEGVVGGFLISPLSL